MNRREFLTKIGLPVVTAAGMVIAAGMGEHVSAGRKRKKASGGGGSLSQGTGSTGNTSNVSGLDLGSGRFKMKDQKQTGSSLAGDDIGAIQGFD